MSFYTELVLKRSSFDLWRVFRIDIDGLPPTQFRALTSEQLEPSTLVSLPDISESQEDDIAFIFHINGLTSGSPKLVPMTYRWLRSVVMKLHHTYQKPCDSQSGCDSLHVSIFLFFFSSEVVSEWAPINYNRMLCLFSASTRNSPLAGDATYGSSTHKHTHIDKLIAQLGAHRHK